MVKETLDNAKKTFIQGEYITLGQFLKFTQTIAEGGMAKFYLSTHEVLVNGEKEIRRGRKLRPGDLVSLDGVRYEIASK